MQLKWLEDYIALAETGNFTRAAEIRCVTHPAFGRRIKSLEDWVGTELIDRTKMPISLTPAGRVFLSTAREIVSILADTRYLVTEASAVPSRRITIATGRTLSHTYLPKLTVRLQNSLGKFNVKVLTTSTANGVKMLADSDVDLLVCYSHPTILDKIDPDEYQYKVIGEERIIAVSAPAAAGLPLYSVPGDISRPRTPLLSFNSSMSLGRVVQSIIEKGRLTHNFHVVYESDMADSIHTMAIQGEGLAWLPASLVEQDLESGLLVRADVASNDAMCQIAIYRSATNPKLLIQKVWKEIGLW